ncbi:hypothetical protein, partial [Streptomyces sp. NPDC005476]|uniref:hypothetical protein n=1 Tax=Streptomyces sp. NPDC005476 TaxID=3156882 RepID=UPI0034533705
DLGGRACSALCGGSTWQTVMNRMPSDYAEALSGPVALRRRRVFQDESRVANATPTIHGSTQGVVTV